MIAVEDNGVAGQPAIGGEEIEIDVAAKYRVRIGGSFDGQALRSCGKIGSPTGSSNPSTTSSITAATPGTR
jgi:hypothetical protein